MSLRFIVRGAVAALIVVVGATVPAGATEWMVVESSAEHLAQGEVLAGDLPIDLPLNSEITVVSMLGQTLEVPGPYQGTLAHAAELARTGQKLSPDGVVGVTRGLPTPEAKKSQDVVPESWTLAGVPLRVAVPAPGGTTDEARLQALLRDVQKDKGSGVDLRLTTADEPADVRLAMKDRKIWFLLPDDSERTIDPRSTYSVPIGLSDVQTRGALLYALKRIAITASLVHLAEESDPGGVEARLTFKRVSTGELEAVEQGRLPTFHHGDGVTLEVENRGLEPVDVTIFFIDGHHRLITLFPDRSGARIESGKMERTEDTLDSAKTSGIERILVMAVRAQTSQPPANLAPLSRAAYAPGRAAPSAAQQGLTAQLARAGYAPEEGVNLPSASIHLFSWRTSPSRD